MPAEGLYGYTRHPKLPNLARSLLIPTPSFAFPDLICSLCTIRKRFCIPSFSASGGRLTSPRRIFQQGHVHRAGGQMDVSHHRATDKDILDGALSITFARTAAG